MLDRLTRTALSVVALALALVVSAVSFLRDSTSKPRATLSTTPASPVDGARQGIANGSLVPRPQSAPSAVSGWSVWGIVKGGQDSPLPGASVCPVTTVGVDGERCVLADTRGHYVLTQLSTESQALFASATGHLSLTQPLDPPFDGDHGRREVLLRLEPGGAPLSGSVVDATGGVVAAAAVTVRSSGSKELLARGESDSEGRFALTSSKDDVVVRAEAEGYSPAQLDISAPARDLRLVLAPAAAIAGQILFADADGPLPLVKVSANAVTFAETHTTFSRDDGSFELQGLAPGRYELVAAGPEWTTMAARWVTVGAGETTDSVLLRLVPASTLDATILVDGVACPKGYVELSGPKVTVETSGADGVVRVEGLPRGSYRVTVGCLDGSSEAVGEELAVSSEPVAREWNLRATAAAAIEDPSCCQPSGTILARVVDDGSRPRSSLGVRLSHASRPGAIPAVGGRRGDAMVFDELALGSYDVYLEQSPETRTRLELVRDGQVSEVLLRAPPPLEIHGTVVDDDGAPIADAWVSASPLGDARANTVTARVLTDLDGAFTLAPVFAGPHALQADGATGSARMANVLAGSRDVVLRVEARGSLTIRVPNTTGNLSSLYWRRQNDSHVEWIPGAGTWSVPSIPPGSYDVIVVTEVGFAAREVVVDAHAAQDVTLEVAPKSHALLPTWVREHSRWESLARAYTGQEKE